MTKEEKLDILDAALLDAMIDIMEKGKTDPEKYDSLSSLATISNYLAKNNKVEEKKKSSVEDEVKKRAQEVKARRAKAMLTDKKTPVKTDEEEEYEF